MCFISFIFHCFRFIIIIVIIMMMIFSLKMRQFKTVLHSLRCRIKRHTVHTAQWNIFIQFIQLMFVWVAIALRCSETKDEWTENMRNEKATIKNIVTSHLAYMYNNNKTNWKASHSTATKKIYYKAVIDGNNKITLHTKLKKAQTHQKITHSCIKWLYSWQINVNE